MKILITLFVTFGFSLAHGQTPPAPKGKPATEAVKAADEARVDKAKVDTANKPEPKKEAPKAEPKKEEAKK
ncbi:hypothetical protein EB118_16500 [bacterium]|nr:hypothetical protein [bacterium]